MSILQLPVQWLVFKKKKNRDQDTLDILTQKAGPIVEKQKKKKMVKIVQTGCKDRKSVGKKCFGFVNNHLKVRNKQHQN